MTDIIMKEIIRNKLPIDELWGIYSQILAQLRGYTEHNGRYHRRNKADTNS